MKRGVERDQDPRVGAHTDRAMITSLRNSPRTPRHASRLTEVPSFWAVATDSGWAMCFIGIGGVRKAEPMHLAVPRHLLLCINQIPT